MKILKFKLLKDFARKHPDAADPLMRWAEFVEKTEWKSHAELKQAFPSADYVGMTDMSSTYQAINLGL
nr:type II toxin-antitoxin system HigB family toxin [Segatella copri]